MFPRPYLSSQHHKLSSKRFLALVVTLTFLSYSTQALSTDQIKPITTLNSDQYIPRWTLEDINNRCAALLQDQKQSYDTLAQQPLQSISPNTVIIPWNTLQASEEDLSGPIGLFANVSPDPAIRTAAEHCDLKLSEMDLTTLQNPKLYEQLTAINVSDSVDKRWKTQMLRQFEEAGAHLDAPKRAELKTISTEIDSLAQAFERAIRENRTELSFTEEDLHGVPEHFLKTLSRNQQGQFNVGLSYPEYEEIMSHAEPESTRKTFYLAFTRRGGQKNLDRLNRIVQLRQQLAILLGVHHYAEWVLTDHMAQTPDNVNHFLDQVADAVEPIEANDRETLRQLKAEHLKQDDAILNRWDILSYENRLKQHKYAIDQEAFRRYFPTDASVKWMFFLAHQLYQIDFEADKTAPIWHPDVQVYTVTDTLNHQRLGTLYLDLYPRTGKYNHAAAFAVRTRSQLLNRHPISVLVTNLSRHGLTHNELETLLHEFGHTLHNLLSNTRYVLQGGTHVERDFVEAPSQMFEEWARHTETLRYLTRFCSPTCPTLNHEQLEKLDAARNLDKGILYARQLLYARYDMELAEGLPPCTNAFHFWKQMESETPWGYLEGSQFPGTFEHIVSGYAAGYYGYMWSEVLALDMTTPFRQHWLDHTIGQRYRKLILSQGGQRPAEEMVHDFLGREPDPKLFFQEITGKRP